MIPFTGCYSIKQYVKNKPRSLGLKHFVLCASPGSVMDFKIYQDDLNSLINQEFGLGPSVIRRLGQTLPPKKFAYIDQ